jgi:phytoene dehydrogenase-like protein
MEETMKYDTIIIGAGLGGLTAGAKLAKEGKKVLLIEQHNIPGGCATTFKRKDFTMEVGLHEMDGLDTKENPPVKMLEDLGVFDSVQFVRVPEFYRFTNQRVDIVVPFGLDKAMDVLIQKFPRDEKGIRKVFNLFMSIQKEYGRLPKEKWKMLALFPILPIIYPNIVLRENSNVGEFLDSIISDEDLKLVLLGNTVFYYHYNPYTMSLLIYALGQASYLSGGGHYIKGGSQKLSDYLASVISNNGGEVLFRHLVTEIIIEGNEAVGIRYTRKSGDDTKIQEAFGNYIVANAAIPNVVNELLPSCEGKTGLLSTVSNQEIAHSYGGVFIGFKKPLKKLGNNNYSTFVFDESISNQSDLERNLRGDFSTRSFVFADYSQIDSQLAPEGKGFGVLGTVDFISDWQRLNEDEYNARKAEMAQKYIERLDMLFPGASNEIELYETCTPKTIKRYTLNPEGSALGFANIPKQFGRKRIPQKSPVRNLYFASAWTVPCGGFSGTITSGYRCAEEILKK